MTTLLHLYTSCGTPTCSGCRKVESGEVNNSDQQMLTEEQASQQFILTCVAYPKVCIFRVLLAALSFVGCVCMLRFLALRLSCLHFAQ